MYAHAHMRRAEYCELLFDRTGLWVSQSTMCRTFQRLELPLFCCLQRFQAHQAHLFRVLLLGRKH